MDAKPVVVGVDGGPDSLKALAWAADYASTVGAPVIAIAAVETPAVVGPYAMAGWVDPEVLEDRARTMLADSVRDTLGDEAQVEQTVIRGHPAEAIVTASQDARLVVVGSRGWGGFRGLLMGSVSQHVVSHAHSPVVVLPRHSEDA
ncbi:universal stress protein UspA [Dietzia natronolimnaea]|uniref:Universal stress protein UspA n=1 Tax=Dietzia natronolimnaea TaxID=161920 RepID=A0A2A2WUU3_9ACTN|nr:universal stress protein [Dietzia natronolimnaea]PAY24823.1 universal stress protein UspA [Dietzia natronolimnaea]